MSDSFGRTTTEIRTVTVVPVYTINEVEYYNDKMFSIGINKSATGFTVTLPETSIEVSDEDSSKDEQKVISENSKKTLQDNTPNFEFKVFDENNQEVYKLEINSTTQINESLFNELKELIIRPGYLFSVNSNDLTKLKVSGALQKVGQVSTVDYSNLTSEDKDAVDNVRFKLTENIIEVVYNSAPEIHIEEDKQDIARNQAIELEDYNLLEGLSVSDDKDDLTLDKIEIKLPSDKDILTADLDKAKELIGQTVTISYQVTDSWGRLSNEVRRNLTIKSAMNDVKIDFLYALEGLIADKDQTSLLMKFDLENGRLSLTAGNNNLFKYSDWVQYGSFAILDENDNVKFSSILGGENTYDTDDPVFSKTNNITNNVSEFINLVNSKKDELEGQNKKLIEYGDKLVFRIAQSPFVYIDGKVIDNKENYSQGANIAGILKNSKFEITPAGLKQIYDGPTMNSGNFSQLTIYNIIAGSQSINMYLDNTNPSNLLLKADALDAEWIDTLNYDKVFRIRIVNANGEATKDISHDGRTKPADFASEYNNYSVENGGYLTIQWVDSSKIKNSKLYNLPRQEYFTEDVDYSGEITDATYFEDVRFYFTDEGIVPTYNSAPTFSGIEDISISAGEYFDYNEGVSVHDDHDGDTLTYSVSGNVDTNTIGEYTLTYTANDSWGRTGTYERKVYVKPTIHENKFEVYTKDNEKSFSIDFEPELTEGSENGKINITKFSGESLDIDRPTDEIFRIWIYDSNGSVKEQVTLLGRDNSSSEKLNVLKEFDYENGDYIKVWRAPEVTSTDSSITGVKVIGDIDGDNVDFTDLSNGIEYMYNTIFYIKPSGLEAYHNLAPILNGVKDKVIYYGDTNYNLLDGVTATNGKGNQDLTVTVTPETITTNKLGTTEVTYYATDNFERTTSQSANVIVRSKSYLNYFEIYGNDTSVDGVAKLYIGFNTDVNSFVFYNSSGEVSIDELDLSEIPSDLNISLYSRFGNERLDIQVLASDTLEEKRDKLSQLNSIKIETFDMLQISTSEYEKVKIKGNISNSSGAYEDGFDSEDDMRNVRFQITNGGLAEAHNVSSDQVTFDGLDKLTIKRGEEIDLIDGVTVTHPNEIISNITVSDFDNLTVGVKTVTYSVQDSWGTTFTAQRTIEVLPFNKLEEVRISVSDTDGTELIKLKFDAIESTLSYELNDSSTLLSKLREVLSLNQELSEDTVVLTVSTFNKDMQELESLSVTKGDIISNSSNLNEIYNIPFIEDGFIGIDIYDFSNTNALDISGPITYSKGANDYHKDMRYIRYHISEEGLNAYYNDAPEVTAKDVEHRISADFNLNSALTISDNIDSSDSMEVEFSEYDLYTVGNYNVEATVRDSWGLETKVTFNVYVLSYLDDNELTLKSDTNKELVTIGFDSKTGKLNIKYYDENDSIPIISSS